jgi:hypothetical protein
MTTGHLCTNLGKRALLEKFWYLMAPIRTEMRLTTLGASLPFDLSGSEFQRKLELRRSELA